MTVVFEGDGDCILVKTKKAYAVEEYYKAVFVPSMRRDIRYFEEFCQESEKLFTCLTLGGLARVFVSVDGKVGSK